jgi:hypothetical protein
MAGGDKDFPAAGAGRSRHRRCEKIPERAKTSHAKAPRRKENKATTLCDLSVFAPLHETAYFFTPSQRVGHPRYTCFLQKDRESPIPTAAPHHRTFAQMPQEEPQTSTAEVCATLAM